MMFSIVSDIVIVSQGGLLYKEGNLVKLVNIVKLVIVVILSSWPDTGAELKAKHWFVACCGPAEVHGNANRIIKGT